MDVMRTLNDVTGGNLLAWKVIGTTAVLALAGVQVVMAARFFQVAPLPRVSPSTALRVHRVNGRVTIGLAILVAFTCLAGPAGPLDPTRVLLHSIFGTLLFVLLAAKFAILKLHKPGQRFVPALGIALFLTFGAIWATSVADYVAST